MSYLKEEEKQAAIELLTNGYEKAAQSFASMTKQKVRIRPTRIDVLNDSLEFLQNLKTDDELILLTTSIIGEHKGKSYLLFNEEEAIQVYKNCMAYNKDEATRSMETEALLKELDNILSAAVITEFSNYMDSTIFGDVPTISSTNQFALKNKIMEDFDKEDSQYFLVADTQFVFENDASMCPQFIWKLTEGFMEGIKKVVKMHQKAV